MRIEEFEKTDVGNTDVDGFELAIRMFGRFVRPDQWRLFQRHVRLKLIIS